MTTKTLAFVPIRSDRGDAPAYSAAEYGEQFATGARSFKSFFETLSFGQITMDVTLHPTWVDGGDLRYTGEFFDVARELYPHHDFVVVVTPWHSVDTVRTSGPRYRPAGAHSGNRCAMTMLAGDGPLRCIKASGSSGLRDKFAWWLVHELSHIWWESGDPSNGGLAHSGYLVCRDSTGQLVPWVPEADAMEYQLITPGQQVGAMTMGTGRHLDAIQAIHGAGLNINFHDAQPEPRGLYELAAMSDPDPTKLKVVRTPLDNHPVYGSRWITWEKRGPRQGLDLELNDYWDSGFLAHFRDAFPGHTFENKVSSVQLDMAPGEAISYAVWNAMDSTEQGAQMARAPWTEQRNSTLRPGMEWTHPVYGYTVKSDPGGWLAIHDMPHVITHHPHLPPPPPPPGSDDPCQAYIDQIDVLASELTELEDENMALAGEVAQLTADVTSLTTHRDMELAGRVYFNALAQSIASLFDPRPVVGYAGSPSTDLIDAVAESIDSTGSLETKDLLIAELQGKLRQIALIAEGE